ncbi:hypothetical protein J6590_017600 [Homalodisca vitripennis]|nr:hypothetical protein J6590_017600 [Homalodisca vitripennis]
MASFSFGDKPLQEGDSASVQCSVSSGDLPISIFWFYNSQPIEHSEFVTISRLGKRVSALTIDSVSHGLVGNYTCLGRNAAGEVKETAALLVNVPPKMMPFSFGDDPFHAGDSATIQCTVSHGDQPLNISWTYNGRPMAPSATVTVSRVTARVSVLTIEPVLAVHIGNYSCHAGNVAGLTEHTSLLLVNVPPQLTPFPVVPVMVGDAAQLSCLASRGDTPLNLSWSYIAPRGQSPKPPPGLTVVPVSPVNSLLLISSISEIHRGMYRCDASNLAGHDSHLMELIVNGMFSNTILSLSVPPRIIPFSFGDAPIFAGQAAQVTCFVSEGDSPLDITWSVEGSSDSSRQGLSTLKGAKVNMLMIDSVEYRHSGNYTCSASNPAGVVTFTTTLEIHVLPRIIPFSFGESAIFAGEAAQVTCLVSAGDLPLDISWSVPPSAKLGVSVTKVGAKASTLLIDSTTHTHRGDYTCTAINRAGVAHYSSSLEIHVVPRIIPFSFGESPIFAGQTAQVTCTVSEGDPPLEISWTFHGPQEMTQLGISTTKVGKKTSLLLIDYANSHHRGLYTCTVKNPAGSANYSTSLNIHVPPRIIPFSFGDTPIFAGEAAQVTCLVSAGDPPLDISWSFHSNTELNQLGISTMKNGQKASMLLIDMTGYQHRGVYTCTAKNPAGVANFSTTLDIHVLPRISPITFDSPIFAGQSVQAACFVSEGDQPLQFSWSFNSRSDLSLLGIGTMNAGWKTNLLIIELARAEHRGLYTCTVRNKAGVVSASARLEIHGNSQHALVAYAYLRLHCLIVVPRILPFNFGESPVFAGQSAQVSCFVTEGDPPIEVNWSFRGLENLRQLGISTTRVGNKASMLVIEAANSLHQGEYTCTAKNPAGLAKYAASLQVHGRILLSHVSLRFSVVRRRATGQLSALFPTHYLIHTYSTSLYTTLHN